MLEKKRKGYGFTGERVMDVSVLLERVLKKTHIDENMHLQTISEHFGEVVGSAVLPHVQLVKLDKRTLVLKAASSAWRSELFLQKKAIIDRCNTLLGEPFIQAIRFA